MDGQVVNIGNEEETTILNLAKKTINVAKSSSSIEFHELPPDDPRRRLPDLSKAKRLLGYRPKVGLEDGLQRTMEWFKPSGMK